MKLITNLKLSSDGDVLFNSESCILGAKFFKKYSIKRQEQIASTKNKKKADRYFAEIARKKKVQQDKEKRENLKKTLDPNNLLKIEDNKNPEENNEEID